MRIAELTPARLVIEDSGSGFALVCVLVGHAIAGLAIAKPPYHLWLLAAEIAAGAALAVYGALGLTKTRTVLDRGLGEIRYTRRSFFRARYGHAYFYEVEEVLLERAGREKSGGDPEAGAFRPAIRVRGKVWPLARAFRDRPAAAAIARAVRAALNEFALGPAGESGLRLR